MTNSIFCFDLDGTLTRRELLPLIANEVGLEHEFDVLTKLTIDGAISFEESLRLRFAILKHVPVSIVQDIIFSASLFDDVIYFIRHQRERCFIVTGNLDVWIKPLMQSIGCNYFSSRVQELNGKLVSLDHILKKSTAVNALRKRYPDSRIVAFGDGLNDYPMFEAADQAVAIGLTHQPSPVLIAKANYIIYEEDALCRLLNTL
ncbi:HAD family phosphatase [Enterobacter asburiae]|jgi:HAD superfamily phosphoserine phosphatase-like hydrolase|nr:HAD family phosphatase [Enterobacter asburiae]HBH7065880.1 HAD family phosphatase [Enterobacter cloacae]